MAGIEKFVGVIGPGKAGTSEKMFLREVGFREAARTVKKGEGACSGR